MSPLRLIGLLLLLPAAANWTVAAPREPVHPRRNVEEFTPAAARFLRFTVRATNRGEPCLDELEVYASGDLSHNVALAANGARASASGSLAGYAIHSLDGVNDGRYGNGRSWIAHQVRAWVQIEFPEVTRIQRVVWGRDREGNFIDRLATDYDISVATDTNHWQVVASSADREPLPAGALNISGGSIARSLVNRFAPVSTTLGAEAGPGPSEYRIDVWQTADGLPGNTVTAIHQTPDGYLWVGTLNGLARFDGLRFQVYGEGTSLAGVRVQCLLPARDGSLWIGSDGGGLLRFLGGNFMTVTRRDGLPSDAVTSLAEDDRGRIWIGTTAGLACWKDGALIDDRAVRTQRGVAISAVVVDGAGAVSVVAANQLLVRAESGVLARPSLDDPSSFSSLLTASVGRSGQLWYGGANGYVGAVSNDVVRVYREQPGQLLEAVWTLCETRGGDLWAGTANGGLRRLRAGRFTSLTTQEGLSDNSVRCLFEDREGSLWIGTVGGGLNRVKPRKLTTFTTRDGLSHNVVMSLAEDAEGTLWVGSNCGGLSARRNGVFAPVYANYLLDNACLWSLLTGRDGSLWMGTWGGGLFRLRGREVQNFSIARSGEDDPVIALCEDNSGADGLWVGTLYGGLKRFRDGRVMEDMRTNGLPAASVTAVVQEPGTNGALWIGTAGDGLHRYDGGRFERFNRPEGLPGSHVRTLYRDSLGVLWIGTGSGLGRLDAGRLTSFGREEGLPDDVISQILEDDFGHLWFGSNRGIFRIRRADLSAVAAGRMPRLSALSYGRAEGLESLECTGGFHPAGLKTHDGRLWFSTVRGLVMVEPGKISINESEPPVVIERVVADGADVLPATLSSEGIELPAGVQRVELQFTALSLVAPERNRFKYRLAPLEKDWVDAGAQRRAAYPRLPSGSYDFHVLACNNDGVWNSRGASVRLTVRAWFWESWGFRAATLAILALGLAWAVRATAVHRWRRKLRRLEAKHAVEKERTRIAQDIHDELGANLTRIALLTELGHQYRDQPEKVAAELGKISATAREAVRAMDAIVWAVNPRNDSLDHFANYVSQYAEEFFRPTTIRCRLDIPADLPEHPLSTEARHHLFLAVKEALTNVVRHSGASEVWLRLGMDNDKLEITVADNGRGLDHTAAASSPGASAENRDPGGRQNGLGNIRQRVENLGGTFQCASSAEGTTIRLRVPIPARVDSRGAGPRTQ